MNGGRFKKVRTAWYEYKDGKSQLHAKFREVRRDEWNVYLKKSDGADVRLDIRNKKVYVNGRLTGKIGSMTQ